MTRGSYERKRVPACRWLVVLVLLAGALLLAVPAQAHAADGESIDITATADRIRQEISGPITAVGVVALIIGGAVFAFSRGNAQKTQQARAGLAAAIVGFLIAVFATGILSTAQSWIQGSSAPAGTGAVSAAPVDPAQEADTL